MFFSGTATSGGSKHPSGLVWHHLRGTWGTSEDDAEVVLEVLALLCVIKTTVSDPEISCLLPASMKKLQAK